MTDEVDYAFHAGLALKNPALAKAFSDERDAIVRELNRLEPWQRDERWAVSVQLSAVDDFERRLHRMARDNGQFEAFQLKLAKANP